MNAAGPVLNSPSLSRGSITPALPDRPRKSSLAEFYRD